MNQPKRQNAFTMIEILVALAVVAIAMGALIQFQLTALKQIDQNQYLTRATLLAQEKLTELTTQPQHPLGSRSGTINRYQQVWKWTSRTDPQKPYNRTLKQIQIQISCPQNKNYKPIQLTTWIHEAGT